MKNIIDNKLLQIVVCPHDKGTLMKDNELNKLICTICKKHYNITESGIPIFLNDKERITNT